MKFESYSKAKRTLASVYCKFFLKEGFTVKENMSRSDNIFFNYEKFIKLWVKI